MTKEETEALRTQIFEMHRFFLEHERKIYQLIFIGISGFTLAAVWCSYKNPHLHIPLGILAILASVFFLVIAICISRQHHATLKIGREDLDECSKKLFTAYRYSARGGGLIALALFLLFISFGFVLACLFQWI